MYSHKEPKASSLLEAIVNTIVSLALIFILGAQSCTKFKNNESLGREKEVMPKKKEIKPSQEVLSSYSAEHEVLGYEQYNEYVSSLIGGVDSIYNNFSPDPYLSEDKNKKTRRKKILSYLERNIRDKSILYFKSESNEYDPNEKTLEIQKKIYSPSIPFIHDVKGPKEYSWYMDYSLKRVKYVNEGYDELHKIENIENRLAKKYDVINSKLDAYVLFKAIINEDFEERDYHVVLDRRGEITLPITGERPAKDTSMILTPLKIKFLSIELAHDDESIIKLPD